MMARIDDFRARRRARRWRAGVLGALMALAASACARPKVDTGARPELQAWRPSAAGWRVEPGDILQVQVWREPTFSTQTASIPGASSGAPDGTPVQADGQAFVPGIGRIPVLGLTQDSLRARVTERLRDRLLDPMVDVQVLRPVPVLGGVRTQGLVYVSPWLSVRAVLARAGGTVNAGSAPKVRVIRQDGTAMQVPLDAPMVLVNIGAGDALWVDDLNFMIRIAPIGTVALGALSALVATFIMLRQ